MAYLLITRPNHDPATTYLYVWSKEIIAFAKSKGVTVLDLKKEKATRAILEKYLNNRKASFIFINGHGTEDDIRGYRDETIIDKSTKSNHISGSLIYARSCNAGNKLGKVLVNNGLKAFIGYKTSFSFHVLFGLTNRPQEDRLAALFLSPSNLIGSTLIKGGTTQDAHDRSIRPDATKSLFAPFFN